MFIGKIGKQWQGQNCLPQIFQKAKQEFNFMNCMYSIMVDIWCGNLVFTQCDFLFSASIVCFHQILLFVKQSAKTWKKGNSTNEL